MQNKIASLLFSTRLMAVLFIVFAAALGIGTFIENEYTTATARKLIYNTWWFETIMVFFVINFIGNIKRYRLHKREKWSSLLLHISFIFILVGAFVTRYISYEGLMPIREGEVANTFLSEKTYLTIFLDGEIDGEPRRREIQEEVLLAPGTDNHVVINTDFKGQPVKVEVMNYIHGAEEGLVEMEDGENYIKIVEAGGGDRHDHFIKEGEIVNIHNVLFTFNKPTDGAINLIWEDGKYMISSPFEGSYMRMADRMEGQVVQDSVQPLMLRSLYNMGGMQFVLPDPVMKGRYDIISTEVKAKGQPDAVKLKVTTNGVSDEVNLMGASGMVNDPKLIKLGGLEIYLNYGSKEFGLPFAIKLKDFIAEKYPGTEDANPPRYAAFKSKVDVIDGEEIYPYEIYMNHVLDHGGYRFFQASFMPDEKGTVLSVSHDWWGTWITYVGYTLLYIGLILILFDRGSRFGDLKKMLKKVKAKKEKLLTAALLLFVSFGSFAQTPEAHEGHIAAQATIDSILDATIVTEKHAADFGRLVIQDEGGRMKPANTYGSELLRKLSTKDNFRDYSSDQVMVSIVQNPALWYNVPIISIKRGNDSINRILKISEDRRQLALTDFFDDMGNYVLAPYLEEAYAAAVPNQFQKDFKDFDGKVNLLYQSLQGKLLRIFPIPGHPNNKWVSHPEAAEAGFEGMDSLYTQQIMPLYVNALQEATTTGNYKDADVYLKSMKDFQKRFGAEVMPSEEKLNAEILYNKYDVFRNLYKLYMLVGILMLLFVILRILNNNRFYNYSIKFFKVLIVILFLVHLAGLIGRWYISGHAPWSDAYESMIYVGFATMLFGLIFGRKSDLTLASTAFVTAMILWVAHLNWMDPAIANLQPVLDSYWLMIHVSIIVGSYGPFTLGMILGIVSLFLMIMTNEKNKKKMDLNIKEITIITEMALTVGLVMLTIGNFLGGQWANESWGRYWGWDPKETWALVSIIIYAFVIHMRLVPGLRSRWIFNFMSVLAYASIMMTYFGVNFYLSGLHSYASGDKVITPTFVYYSLAFVLILGAVSYWRHNKYFPKKTTKKIEE